MRTNFDAPYLPTTDSNGNPIVDASGNQVVYATKGSKSLILPTVGIGVQHWASKTVNWEANISGFDIPHHAHAWDADASLNLRVSHYEVRFGAKIYHFRTSPNSDFWMEGTIYGPMVALRWHSDDVK